VTASPDLRSDDIETLRTALAAAHAARLAAEARTSCAEAMVEQLKLLIAKYKRDRFGQSSERARHLDQLELQLEELEATAAEDAVAAVKTALGSAIVQSIERGKPVRAPLPAHLPRERVVIPAPCCRPDCGGKLAKLGEDVTETLEVIPRQWKVIQTVREKFSCRACEAIPSRRRRSIRSRAAGPVPVSWRCLCRIRRSLQGRAKTGAIRRGCLLEPWAPQVLLAGRYHQDRRGAFTEETGRPGSGCSAPEVAAGA
jgi:hypothetical protein